MTDAHRPQWPQLSQSLNASHTPHTYPQQASAPGVHTGDDEHEHAPHVHVELHVWVP